MSGDVLEFLALGGACICLVIWYRSVKKLGRKTAVPASRAGSDPKARGGRGLVNDAPEESPQPPRDREPEAALSVQANRKKE